MKTIAALFFVLFLIVGCSNIESPTGVSQNDEKNVDGVHGTKSTIQDCPIVIFD